MSGKCDFFGMSATHVELAKEAGLFDEYVRVGSVGSTSWYIAFNLDRRMYNNFNDVNAMASPQSHGSVDEITGGAETSEIEDDAARTHAAVNNRHFRLAIAFAFDRASYMAQGMGEDLKYVRLRNTFVPGDYVKLEADTTIEINGTSTRPRLMPTVSPSRCVTPPPARTTPPQALTAGTAWTMPRRSLSRP